MLKDIDFRKVKDTAMAIVSETVGEEEAWFAYLINMGPEGIESVLIRSKGYGEVDGRKVKTSELRQFVEKLGPGQFIKVEEIRKELLSLHNEFWVSFSKSGYLFDKKYVFLTETLHKDNFTIIPQMEQKGVLIR